VSSRYFWKQRCRQPRAPDRSLRQFFWGDDVPFRVTCFIDGFNLYHAIKDMNRPELKWIDLRKLMECFTDPHSHAITAVYYFSAYATWLPGPYGRHKQYVAAIAATGCTPIMGHFKNKHRQCSHCGFLHKGHEEKESDVHIATRMVCGAFDDEYDHAFLLSRDSDLAPPLRLIRGRFPLKKIKIIAPPGRLHSKELGGIATHRASIKTEHLERCLLPQTVADASGMTMATRPRDYDPPV